MTVKALGPKGRVTEQGRCPTCHRKYTRTHPQNARYWLLLHRIAEMLRPGGREYSADTWHHYFKGRLLGFDEVRLPNGKTHTIVRSTADLTVDQFSDYMAAVEAWAMEHSVWLDEVANAA
jgi:hypothetical protein